MTLSLSLNLKVQRPWRLQCAMQLVKSLARIPLISSESFIDSYTETRPQYNSLDKTITVLKMGEWTRDFIGCD
jgi:hypothetical protein